MKKRKKQTKEKTLTTVRKEVKKGEDGRKERMAEVQSQAVFPQLCAVLACFHSRSTRLLPSHSHTVSITTALIHAFIWDVAISCFHRSYF